MENLQLLPFPELETDRLCLRRILRADKEEIFFLRSDPRMMRYIDKEPCQSRDEVIKWIALLDERLEEGEGINWGITMKGESKLIGTIGLWRFDKPHFRAEVGYMLHPGFWGRGFAEEALRRVVRQAFELYGFHSIEANTNPDNVASARVLEKVGFVREAYFRENWYFRGKFLDSAVYSILNPSDGPKT